MNGSLGRVVLLSVAFVLTGCASLAVGPQASQCGNPCATLSCPSAFTCFVDARCQPEPARSGFP